MQNVVESSTCYYIISLWKRKKHSVRLLLSGADMNSRFRFLRLTTFISRFVFFKVKTRAEIEEYEEKAGKFSKRPWLGQMIEMAPRPSSSSSMQGQESAAAPEPPQKVWEITPEALGPAIAYILGGLLKSGHVVTTQHNRWAHFFLCVHCNICKFEV